MGPQAEQQPVDDHEHAYQNEQNADADGKKGRVNHFAYNVHTVSLIKNVFVICTGGIRRSDCGCNDRSTVGNAHKIPDGACSMAKDRVGFLARIDQLAVRPYFNLLMVCVKHQVAVRPVRVHREGVKLCAVCRRLLAVGGNACV